MKQNKSTKGFTLIELLIVVGVIAVLAGIVLVSLRGAKEGAELARAKRDAATNNRLLVCEQGKMMDLEGNLYDTVEIDGLCWMKENLKYIPKGEVLSKVSEEDTTNPHYYVYGYGGGGFRESN